MPRSRRSEHRAHVLHFHIGDWRKDPGVRLLTLEEKGIWLEMLILMHECKPKGFLIVNSKALTVTEITILICGWDNPGVKAGVARIVDLNIADVEFETGAIFSRRMVRDERNRITSIENGKKGGNPILGVNPKDKLRFTGLPIKEKEEATLLLKRKRGRPKKEESRISNDWQPDDETSAEIARECPDVDQVLQLKLFRNHFIAAPGRFGLKKDWGRTFVNWCLRWQSQTVERRRNGKFEGAAERKDRKFEDRVTKISGPQRPAIRGHREDPPPLPPPD